jgi:hypothetical protein
MLPVENLISLENLIITAKNKGLDLGKGDPYNRLRYYTKIGWMPHMVRIGGTEGNTQGHYPYWALDQLLYIEKLKTKNLTNEDIAKKLQARTKIRNIGSTITSKEFRLQAITYSILALVIIILANQLNLIHLGRYPSVSQTLNQQTMPDLPQIIDSGTAFIPKNQNEIFVKNTKVRSGSKINITFTANYSPASRYWVSTITEYSGFVIKLDAPVRANCEFNWWLSN